MLIMFSWSEPTLFYGLQPVLFGFLHGHKGLQVTLNNILQLQW